jgi:hypothetical protein
MFFFYLLIGGAILLGGLYALRWFSTAEPKALIKAGKIALAIAISAVATWLVATGRLGQAIVLASALAPLFMRWRGLWTSLRNRMGPSRGQSSGLETGWLRMELDHDSGALDGLVLRGVFAGRRLGELSRADLLHLLGETRIEDPESANVIEAYLDRLHPDWRAQGGEAPDAPPSAGGAMTRAEALSILGLREGADESAIRAAHRKLMLKLHPDQGGSTYLAAKINQAKDLLLE